MTNAASEAVAGVRAGRRDLVDEELRRAWLQRALAATDASDKTLRKLANAPDFDARLEEAEGTLALRGFAIALLDEAPDGFRLLFAERAARLVERLGLDGGGEPLDGCSGRCAACPQKTWCDFGRDLTRA